MSTISETQPERISVAQFSAQAKGEILASEFGHPSVQANELVDVTNDKVVNGVDTPASHSTQEQTSRPETVASYPVSDLKLEDRCIDDFRPLRVAVIGAGLSGILSGILLPLKVPEIQLTIFERSRDVVSA